MATKSNAKAKGDLRLDVVQARFWAAFGSGAGLLIEDECVEAARQKGYFTNVEGRLNSFKSPKVMKNTLSCCFEAGKEASVIALRKGESTVTAATYIEAVEIVESRLNALIARSEELAKLRASGSLGGVC